MESATQWRCRETIELRADSDLKVPKAECECERECLPQRAAQIAGESPWPKLSSST